MSGFRNVPLAVKSAASFFAGCSHSSPFISPLTVSFVASTKKMADVKRVKTPQEFMSELITSRCCVADIAQLISLWVVSLLLVFTFRVQCMSLTHPLRCRPLPRPPQHPSSVLSCWCKIRMRWSVAASVIYHFPTYPPFADQTRPSRHSLQGHR